MKTGQALLLAVIVGMTLTAQAAPDHEQIVLKPEQLQALSLDEMLAQGEVAARLANERVTSAMGMLGDAREANDVQRINCLSDYLTTMKGLARLADQNLQTLRERVAARDRTAAEHEYVKVMIARNKVLQMYSQAKGCGGVAQETIFEGEPLVEQVFDRELPLGSGSDNLGIPMISVEPPPSASPYY